MDRCCYLVPDTAAAAGMVVDRVAAVLLHIAGPAVGRGCRHRQRVHLHVLHALGVPKVPPDAAAVVLHPQLGLACLDTSDVLLSVKGGS
jgi:hypothetical protein